MVILLRMNDWSSLIAEATSRRSMFFHSAFFELEELWPSNCLDNRGVFPDSFTRLCPPTPTPNAGAAASNAIAM